MAHTSAAMVKLVRQVKEAVLHAQEQLDRAGVKIGKVELEIRTSLKKAVEGGVKLEVLPVELSGHYDNTNVQTINLTLTPQPSLELMGTVDEELSEAIQAISTAADEAARSSPAFALHEAALTLAVSYTRDGKVKVLVGGGAEMATAHTIKLTVNRAE